MSVAQPTKPHRREWSTLAHLVLLVVALLVPALVFMGVLLSDFAAGERARYQREALEGARRIAASVDRDLAALKSALLVLASSPLLQSGDVEKFYRQALDVRQILGAEIALRDVSGQQLVNTRLPWGAPLPSNMPESDRQTIETRQAYVSDLFTGATAKRLVVSVTVPVLRDGDISHVLVAGFAPERLVELLKTQEISPDWTAAIVDRNGTIVARSRQHERFVGSTATADLRANATGEEGSWIGTTAEGTSVLSAYALSRLSGWRVAVGVPTATTEAPLRQSLTVFILSGLAAIAFSAAAATWFGHRVARPMRELARAGASLGRGESVSRSDFAVSEVNDVARALATASVDLRTRARERDEVEAALRDSEAQFRQLAEALPMIVWVMHPDGEAIYQNQRFREYHGYDVSPTLADRSSNIHPDDKAPAWAIREPAVAQGAPFQTDVRLRRADGIYRWHRMSAVPLKRDSGEIFAWVGTATDIDDMRRGEQSLKSLNETLEAEVAERTRELRDKNERLLAEITQRETIEEQLRQAQKMEAVGQLTGGIAHDFNNLLAVITGSLQMLQRRLDRGEASAAQRYIDGAMEGASRAATLTHRLLAFSRQQPLAPEPIDANKLVAGMSDLLRRTIGEGMRIETVLAGGLWRTHADPNQLENAVLNLAVNARDAMGEGGRLTIETANCDLDDRYAAENAGVSPGQYVLIAVTDTGTGMTPEVMAKAFDPFFTTKPLGQGTGLGLSQVYGFVRQSGGHVKLYSEAGEGTTVKLYLPRFFDAEAREPSDRPHVPLAMGESNEVILVVEDDAAVRRLSVEALRELGYGVLEAETAIAALRLLDDRSDIVLLFTDIVMPDMNGRKLAEEALRRRPRLKVLFTTGYTRNAVVHNGVLDPGVNLLGKPFTIEQLASKVRDVLDLA